VRLSAIDIELIDEPKAKKRSVVPLLVLLLLIAAAAGYLYLIGPRLP
jgi:hypothetical protein